MRHELIKTSLHFFEKKEISLADLYKNKNGLAWHEKNKEVVIAGEFYEVIKVERQNDKAILFIIKDNEENKLFNSFFSADKKRNDLLCSIVKLLFNLQSEKISQPDLRQQVSIHINLPSFADILFDSQYYFKKTKPPRTFSFA